MRKNPCTWYLYYDSDFTCTEKRYHNEYFLRKEGRKEFIE